MAFTFGLAPLLRVWLIANIQVRAARRASRLGAASKAVLASFMALLLLIAATLSVSHNLHQTLHRDGAVSGHFCLVCSLAKGQVSGPEVLFVLALAVLSLLFYICVIHAARSPGGFDYCVSLGRAPPVW